MARPDASIQKAHPCDPWVLMVVHLLGTVKHAGEGGTILAQGRPAREETEQECGQDLL